jgi:hypothetical protein
MSARVVKMDETARRIPDLRNDERILAFCGDGYFVVGRYVRPDLKSVDLAQLIADGLNDARCTITPPSIFTHQEEETDG